MSTDKPLNKIIRETKGNKKFKVFVRDQSTNNVKTVRFGDASMKIRSNNKNAKKSFNSRMKGVLAKVDGQKTLSPAYWSLRAWNSNLKV
ncbi:MAG: hypothetical protein CBC04_08630 [Verrucomicrobia bacterium TMED44]|nr:MAG: hypothetical protein CBC04_08630 [Verrucomicrobia bacterium TMED44]|tara:strand:- start:114 stop:380 length:267 start_codon:yes stop_codon:yes gene_type:complete